MPWPIFNDGKILFRDGALAMSADCCCDWDCCTECPPDPTKVEIRWTAHSAGYPPLASVEGVATWDGAHWSADVPFGDEDSGGVHTVSVRLEISCDDSGTGSDLLYSAKVYCGDGTLIGTSPTFCATGPSISWETDPMTSAVGPQICDNAIQGGTSLILNAVDCL